MTIDGGPRHIYRPRPGARPEPAAPSASTTTPPGLARSNSAPAGARARSTDSGAAPGLARRSAPVPLSGRAPLSRAESLRHKTEAWAAPMQRESSASQRQPAGRPRPLPSAEASAVERGNALARETVQAFGQNRISNEEFSRLRRRQRTVQLPMRLNALHREVASGEPPGSRARGMGKVHAIGEKIEDAHEAGLIGEGAMLHLNDGLQAVVQTREFKSLMTVPEAQQEIHALDQRLTTMAQSHRPLPTEDRAREGAMTALRAGIVEIQDSSIDLETTLRAGVDAGRISPQERNGLHGQLQALAMRYAQLSDALALGEVAQFVTEINAFHVDIQAPDALEVIDRHVGELQHRITLSRQSNQLPDDDAHGLVLRLMSGANQMRCGVEMSQRLDALTESFRSSNPATALSSSHKKDEVRWLIRDMAAHSGRSQLGSAEIAALFRPLVDRRSLWTAGPADELARVRSEQHGHLRAELDVLQRATPADNAAVQQRSDDRHSLSVEMQLSIAAGLRHSLSVEMQLSIAAGLLEASAVPALQALLARIPM